jgi:hypothetical protein
MKPKKHILFIYFSLVNRIKIERIWKGKKTAHSFQALIINFGSQISFLFVKVVMMCVMEARAGRLYGAPVALALAAEEESDRP